MRRSVNYVSQLRPYSFVDLLLLLLAIRADLRTTIGTSLLWFGFLIHLEWRHRDRGRLFWHWSTWFVLWLTAVFLVPSWWLIPFFALAIGYTYKKKIPAAAAISPVLNGGLKMMLILICPTATVGLAVLVFVAMTLRNLLGDVRDAAKDARERVMTIPVLLGYVRTTPFVYPAGLAMTSALWTILGGLPWWALASALIVQVSTYHLTPR